jgi:peptidylprolyl isomerase
MTQAKSGDTVQVHYKGTLTDGTLFDSSESGSPLEFQLGSGMVIQGFDDGITGMSIGEKKQILIDVEQAYGAIDETMVFEVNRLEIPDNIPLQVGSTLNMHQDGSPYPMQVIIREITATKVKLDANHPLAGQALIFDLELVSIS